MNRSGSDGGANRGRRIPAHRSIISIAAVADNWAALAGRALWVVVAVVIIAKGEHAALSDLIPASTLPLPMLGRDDEPRVEHAKMTFGQHLDELRMVLIKAVAAWVLGLVVALAFAGPLVEYVQTPLKQ